MPDDGSDSFYLKTEFDERTVTKQSIHEVLDARAEQLEDETYAYYGPENREVSFGEISQTSNGIGNSLAELGLEKGDRVSVMVDNKLQTLFGFFGILKAGGVYCPINTDYKGSILSYQLNDTDPTLLIIDEAYLNRLNQISDELTTDPHVVVRSTDEADATPVESFAHSSFDDIREPSMTKPSVDVAWHDPSSIIYTSGTTGKPKGCVCSHRYFLGGVTFALGQVMDSGDVAHNVLPMNHIAGIGIPLILLIHGGSVALWDQFSPHDFWDRIDQYGATYTFLMSVMIPWLMNAPEQPDDDENTLKMAAMVPVPDNYEEIASRFGFDIIPMMYAQTETSVSMASFIHAVEENDGTPEEYMRGARPEEIIEAAEALGVPVLDEVPGDRFMGRPIPPLAEATVVDDVGEKLPPGETGELLLRPKEPSLFMDEYFGKPTKTVEVFQDLWVHTGDAVYRDDAGNYYFVDRIGDTIRRRGENISSLQVQDAVNSHESVEKAAVFPLPAPEGGEDQIACAVELPETASLTEPELRTHLEGRLPEFMIPDRIQFLEEIPTTATNKMEKYKLRNRF